MAFGGLIDGIIFACGIYMLYSAYLMKTKGELKVGWLVSKNIDLKKSKDVSGYINYMYPRVIIFSICTLIYSFVGFYGTYVASLGLISTVTFFGFFVVVVWFAIVSTRASKRFLSA